MKSNTMKTGILIIIFLNLLSIMVYAGGPDGYMEYDWNEIKQVKGDAKECTIAIEGNEGMFPDMKVWFNEKGKIIKSAFGAYIKEFIYDKTNQLVEITDSYLSEDDKPVLMFRTVYQYDAKGQLKKKISFDSEGTEIMVETGITYDKNGNINIEVVTPEGSVYGIDTYNKDFNLTSMIRYTGDSVAMGLKTKDIESKTTIKYDKDGNMTEKVITYVTKPFEEMPEVITQKFQYKLDAKGNKIEQITTVTPEAAEAMFFELARPPIKFTYVYGQAKTNTTIATPKDDKKENKFTRNQKVEVEYEGSWYPAVILEIKADKYLIHYTDYDSSWDEWVGKERLK